MPGSRFNQVVTLDQLVGANKVRRTRRGATHFNSEIFMHYRLNGYSLSGGKM